MTGRAEYIGTSHRSNRVVRVPVLVEIASLRREIESTFALTLSLGHLANDAESHLSASDCFQGLLSHADCRVTHARPDRQVISQQRNVTGAALGEPAAD